MEKVLTRHAECFEKLECINRFIIVWLIFGTIMNDGQVFGINDNNTVTILNEIYSTIMPVKTNGDNKKYEKMLQIEFNQTDLDIERKNNKHFLHLGDKEILLKNKNVSKVRKHQKLNKNQVNKTLRKKNKSATPNLTADGKLTSNKSYSPIKRVSKVSILGLFEMTTLMGERRDGKSELAASELAVKHINELGLLPGYTLELINNDTQVKFLT